MQASATINARYEIRGLVGRGGMGLVYRAYDTVVGREVALKTVGDIQGRSAIEMFYKEWRILANLHHPNIIEIFDIGEFEDAGVVKPFFVMPLLKGMTLEQMLHTPGQQLSPERLCDIISQTCRGLQAIHDNGLVHRDLKPSNIFVLDFNSVKLIDFGIAHLANADTATGLKGTVSYMSPEQISGQECSSASDLFALGVVCYEALCGVKPFQGRNTDELFDAILHSVPQPIYELNPSVSQTVSRVIHKALAKEPRHRYSNAIEFSETLWKALRGEAIPALDPTRIQPRIQRAIKAFEQGNYDMATEILSDLEASGHIDPALVPLRKQINDAMRRTKVRDLLDRAKMGLAEEEFALALQNAEAVLKIEPDNQEAAQLRTTIQAEIAARDIDEWLKAADIAVKQYGFGRARQLLGKVLELRPGEPRATALLQDLESREQAYRAARQEKENLFRAAKEAWQNAEFDTAALKIERVLELEARAPDTATDGSANYANFVEMVQSARAAIEQVKTEVPRAIEAGEYKRALELCKEAIAKYPGHPVPQALKLAAEAHWRHGSLAKIAALTQEADAQPDLARKLEVLQRALQAFPNEPLFEQWARPVREQLALANGVAEKARSHEEHGRFHEALEQWQMLLTVDPGRAGLQQEIERVARLAGTTPTLVEPAPYKSPPSRAAFAPSEPTLPVASPVPPAPRPQTTGGAKAQGSPDPVQASEPKQPGWFARGTAAGSAIAKSLPARSRNFWHWSTQPSRRMITATGAAAILLIGAGLVVTYRNARRPSAPPKPPKPHVALRSSTQDAVVTIAGTAGRPGAGVDAELAPGTYSVEVSRDGYEPYQGAISVPAGGLTQTLPPLTPLDTAIHITSDLPSAKIRLDDRPETTMDQSDYTADDLKPGDHTLVVSDSRSEARLTFTAAPGQAPEVKGPIAAKELLAFAAASLGPNLKIIGAATPSVSVDNAPGTPAPDGTFQFNGLSRQPHEVAIGTDKDRRSFVVGTDRHPALWVSLTSDRNVGSLTVSTALSSFKVFLDGKPYTRSIRDGSMNIRNLPAKHYQFHVAADGFETSADIDVEIKKGQSISQQINLKPIPQFSTLAVQGLPAHTQILIDNNPAGTADDGTARIGKINPGDHEVEFRNLPRYKTTSVHRSFPASGTITITESDVTLTLNPATLTFTSSPAGAQFSWTCGQTKGTGETASCAESQITVTASLAGFQDQTRPIALTPGQTLKETFEMKRAVVTPARVLKSCSSADLAASGWTQEESWYVAGNSSSLPCAGLTGHYQFTLPIPSGGIFGGKAFVWIVGTNAGGQKQFELQKKSFQLRGSSKVEIGKYEHNGTITFRITVEPGRIIHEVHDGDSWHQVSSVGGDFKGAKILFLKDARIANFSFHEQ